ncbi:MAG: class I SAM-dependent methyltransferase [Dehalococcoidales bacterium]|nr:MAG: class I SAM-dependent methyltransferase [Dehalococcoidales bacterium]
MRYLYEHFSKYYDLFFENNAFYNRCIQFIEATLQEYGHNPKSLLELACGTGIVLEHFVGKYEISGLDISAPLLERAKEKFPDVPFYEMNMASFQLNKRYDIILCMYDSINHLLEYQNWINTFQCVKNHMNSGSIFIFDMTTQEALDRLTQSPAQVLQVDDTYLIANITKDNESVVNWNLKVFNKVKGNIYELKEDNIKEITFSQQKVHEGLQKLFGKIKVQAFQDVSDSITNRLFFVCQV